MPLTVIGLACTWQLAVVPPPCDPGAPCVAGTFLGIPLGLYGAAYFLAQLMLLTTAIYQGEYDQQSIPTYGAMVGIGTVISSFLVGWSVVTPAGVCGWCLALFVFSVLQAGFLLTFTDGKTGRLTPASFIRGAGYGFGCLLLLAVFWRFIYGGPTGYL